MRERFSKNPIVGVVALIVLVAAWFWILKPKARSADGAVYFLDLGTHELYAEAKQTLSPTTAPSGAQGVRAYVFACGQCSEDNRFVGFVEQYSDEAKAAIQDNTAVMKPQLLTQGQLVAAEDARQWVPKMSPAGEKLIRSAQDRCTGKAAAKVCTP